MLLGRPVSQRKQRCARAGGRGRGVLGGEHEGYFTIGIRVVVRDKGRPVTSRNQRCATWEPLFFECL